MVKYSKEPASEKACKAMGVELRTSFKNTYNVAQAIKGMKLKTAQAYLDAVIDKKRIIPFRRFRSGVSRDGQAREFKHTTGRWPEKSCKVVQGLLVNAQSNAEFKNLDPENLVVKHILVNRAQQGRRRTYRAHGRINAYCSSPCHIELILQEEDESVEKPDNTKTVKFTKRQMARNRLTSGN